MAKLTKKQIQDLASYGRNGDTILAHINPQEAALLKSRGGAGTVNPQTGLPEFYGLNFGFPSYFPEPEPLPVLAQVFNPNAFENIADKLNTTTVPQELLGFGRGGVRPAYEKIASEFDQYADREGFASYRSGAPPVTGYTVPTDKTFQDKPLVAKYDAKGNFIHLMVDPQNPLTLDPNQPNILATPTFNKTGGITGYGVYDANEQGHGGFGDFVREIATDLGPILSSVLAYYMPGITGALAPSLASAGITNSVAQSVISSALANTVVSIAQGTPVDQAFKSGIVNATVSMGAADLAPYVKEVVDNPYVASAVVNASATVAQGALLGQSSDQIKEALSGSIAGSTAALVNLVPGFSDLPVPAKNVISSSIKASLLDRPIDDAATQALINSGLQSAANGVIANNKIREKYGREATTEEIQQFAFYASPSRLDKEIEKYFASGKGLEIQSGDFFAADGVTKLTPQQIESYVNKDVATSENDQSYNDFMDDFYRSIGLDPESIPKALPTTFDPLEIYNEQFLNDPSLDLVNVVAQQEEDPSLNLDYPSLGENYVVGSREEDPSLDVVNVFGSPEEDPFLDLLDASPEDNLLTNLNPDTYAKSISQVFNSSIPNINTPSFNTIAAPAFAINTLLDENENPITQSDLANLTFNWNPSQVEAPEDAAAYGQLQLDPRYTYAAHGGLMSLARGGIATLGGYSDGGRLLKGPGDGMSDNIPAMIGAKQPARLADGEFVIPADVVSHLGNGSTEAGANVLYKMMNKVRHARTGNPKQGKQINPKKFIPS